MSITTLPKTGRGGNLHHGQRVSFAEGDEIALSCDLGYQDPVVSVFRVVLNQGTLSWEPDEINCKPITELNDLPDTGPGGDVQTAAISPYHIGDKAYLTCSNGYVLPLNVEAEVQLQNNQLAWVPSRLLCDPKPCNPPPSLQHASINNRSYFFPERFSYVCDQDYRFSHPNTNEFTCNAQGQWEPQIPRDAECLPIECPDLGGLPKTLMVTQGRAVGSSILFQCIDGYTKKRGDEIRICQVNGTWDGTDLVCVPKPPNPSIKTNAFIFKMVVTIFSLILIIVAITLSKKRGIRSAPKSQK